MHDKLDILGTALKDFFNEGKSSELMICGEDMEEDIMDVAYYFRPFDEMPEIEKEALTICKGKVLDVGAGAGSHSLYLQKNNLLTTAIDISPGAVEVMKQRGVLNAVCNDINYLEGAKFDTILLLMNGIGISGKLKSLKGFIEKLFSILSSDGQVIFDSTDLRYLFMEDDGSLWIDLSAKYYGELVFNYCYKGKQGKPFPWLYIDEDTMKNVCTELGINMEVIYRADDFHYLGKLYR